MSTDPIASHFEKSLAALTAASGDLGLLTLTRTLASIAIDALRQGRKLLIAGNGGSAADAQHIAAEIIGRYKMERSAWPAIALTTDTSALTAIANDYGYEKVFARQVEGLGQRGDVFWGLSTSGKSPNVVAALQAARERGLITVGFTGLRGSAMGQHCDHLFVAPHDEAAIIQQIHLTAAHAICDQIEVAITGGQSAP